MPMTVRIDIVGLALCFRKPTTADYWTVLFPCDNVHELEFKYMKPDGTPDTYIVHPNRSDDQTIEFDRSACVAAAPVEGSVREILNLNASYAHDGSLNEYRFKDKIDEVRMTVPFARLDGHDDTPDPYFVQRMDTPGSPIYNIGSKAQRISLTFSIQKELTMWVKRRGVLVKEIKFPYVDGGLENAMKFDNDCKAKCKHNDSLDLYELVRDEDEQTQFCTGKIMRPPNNFSHRNWDFTTGARRPGTGGPAPEEDDGRSATYGNCDPAWGDPPPGP